MIRIGNQIKLFAVFDDKKKKDKWKHIYLTKTSQLLGFKYTPINICNHDIWALHCLPPANKYSQTNTSRLLQLQQNKTPHTSNGLGNQNKNNNKEEKEQRNYPNSLRSFHLVVSPTVSSFSPKSFRYNLQLLVLKTWRWFTYWRMKKKMYEETCNHYETVVKQPGKLTIRRLSSFNKQSTCACSFRETESALETHCTLFKYS